MKVYTGVGDLGTTNILGANGLSKSDPRIEAYGSIDELNSYIGLLITYPMVARYEPELREIQNHLFNIGSELASTNEALGKLKIKRVDKVDIKNLENSIDKQTEVLEPLKAFILPGSCRENAICHLARTVCRRAERNIIEHHQINKVDGDILVYVNRLSDYFFTLSRTMSRLADVHDIEWHP